MVVDNARGDGAPGRFDAGWVEVLQNHFGALKHAEFGLGVALMKAQRDGMTQMINNTILTNASYKLRLSQDITLYLADIGLDIKLDGDAGKRLWLEDGCWQGTRKVIEAILAAGDHLEIYFAVNVVFEALVGELFRSGFVMRAGPVHNDFVTPAVVSAAASDYRQNLANTLVLMGLLTGDASHGQANKKIMQGWLAKYVPLCAQAARDMKPLWSLQNNGDLDFEVMAKESRERFNDILVAIQINLPEGVTA
jgi:propane monooxygenase small subunit